MADQKISELTALTGANVADDDAIAIVDTSATETKKIVFSELKTALDTATGFVRITGDTMTGNLNMGDNVKAIFGGATSELQIYSDGSHSYIHDAGGGDLYVRADDDLRLQVRNSDDDDWVNAVHLNSGGETAIHYNGDKKLATTSTGISVTGNATFADNGKAIFGAGSDLQIYHDGNSKITDVGDGKLELHSNGTGVTIQKGATEYMAQFLTDGAVTLYHDNSPKLATTSTGVDVTGTVSAESLGIGTASPKRHIHLNGGNETTKIQITNQTTGSASDGDGFQIGIATDGTANIEQRENADLNFYTNNDLKMTLDSSGNVGIGESSPLSNLHIEDTSGAVLTLGNSQSPNDVVAGTVFGRMNFYASDRSGTTSTGGVARIEAIASAGYSGSTPSDLLFYTHGTSANDGSALGNPTERMRIDSSGAVVINNSGGDAQIYLGGTSGTSRMYLARSGADSFLWNVSNGNIRFGTNDTERMRINSDGSCRWTPDGTNPDMTLDASGNLLVGTTDIAPTSDGETGFVARSSGYVIAGASGQQVMLLNRSGVDGDILQFRKSGAPVGSIGVSASNNPYFSASVANHGGLMFSDGGSSTPQMNPLSSGNTLADDVMNIGSSSYRFKDLYLSGIANLGDRVLVNGATSNAQLSVLGAASFRAQNVQVAVDGHTAIGFFNASGTEVGGISVDASATAFNTSSDYRLKTDAQPMTGATDRLKQLNPVNFEWIVDGTRVDGFLAHEAQAVVPEAVTGAKDAMRDEEYEVTPAVTDDDGNVVTEAVMGTRSVPDYQGIDQSKLVPLLVATIKELEARITALENA